MEYYQEQPKSRKWTDWIMDHAVEIILIGGVVIAYKLGRVNGYTDCLMDMKRLATRR